MTPSILLTAVLALPAGVPGPTAESGAGRLEAAALVRGGLAAASTQGVSAGRRMAILAQACETATRALGSARSAQVLRQQVRDARWLSLTDEGQAASWLEQQLQRTAQDLAFEPVTCAKDSYLAAVVGTVNTGAAGEATVTASGMALGAK